MQMRNRYSKQSEYSANKSMRSPNESSPAKAWGENLIFGCGGGCPYDANLSTLDVSYRFTRDLDPVHTYIGGGYCGFEWDRLDDLEWSGYHIG